MTENPRYIGLEENKRESLPFGPFVFLTKGSPLSKEDKDLLTASLTGFVFNISLFQEFTVPKGCYVDHGWLYDFRGFKEIKRFLIRFEGGTLWYEYWAPDFPSLKRLLNNGINVIAEKVEIKKKV